VHTKTDIDQRLRSHRLRTVSPPHRRDDDRRMTGRRLAAAGFGAFVAFWVARALFKWILDVDGTTYIALAAAFAIIGAATAVAIELEEERKSSNPPTE
jgi:predicted outer membrane lipoprotein